MVARRRPVGTTVFYSGAVGLILIAVLPSVALAGVEVVLLHAVTTLRVACVIGVVQGALLYGSGPQTVVTICGWSRPSPR
ncbi:hypothetical protein AWW66_05355 [Micromonospora rosaria]|uniref:Uncharacterized protein n=1 Tax=Micromonospora rosaria TaxID=47874 RepID=A0A136PX62_9ACTN|nr:hypothetical protein [Micromonospora rosaria]KXK63070.1 hypothetical protein AWW66_05355 [Micromonospora rosaria]